MQAFDRIQHEIISQGYTILNQVIPFYCLDAIRAKMDEDAQTLLERGGSRSYGHVPGHLQLNPPTIMPYVFEEVITNVLICSISKAILGEHAVHHSYSGNTNCPQSQVQPIHCDYGHLWHYFPEHPPASLVINIPLEDVTEANGSTEVWPGSHKIVVSQFMDLSQNKKVPQRLLDEWGQQNQSIRLNLKKGDVVIRDPRMWHCGTINHTQHFRHMIAMIHSAPWVHHHLPTMLFHDDCRVMFERSYFKHNVQFTNDDIDYLNMNVLTD